MMIKAHGKINIALNVLGKLDETYHEVDMVMVPVELHDSIEIKKNPGSNETFVTCDMFDISEDRFNLVSTAINLLKEAHPFNCGFRISIFKGIPISGGMGGGSADAAAVLKAIIKILKLDVSNEELFSIAKKVGSDVPFCLNNIPARARGRGEILEYLNPIYKYHVLIIKPKKGLSTKQVFEHSDSLKLINTDINNVIQALYEGNDELLEESMSNALQLPATQLLPEINDVIAFVKNSGVKLVQMTGSGSCIFALSKSKKQLISLMYKLLEKNYVCELTKFM